MISVIIPTYNRLEKLKKTLDSLMAQTLDDKNFEVILVDDGSEKGVEESLPDYIKVRLNLKIFRQENKGPAAARNLGVSEARGEIIFFCGDDTLLCPDLLARHLKTHQKKKDVAVLGLTLWEEDGRVTDFMRYLAPAGPQFHYNTIKDQDNAGFDHFYTSNISLEKKWLAEEKFDTRFREAAFEDIDLGLRLEKKGLKIVYDEEALAFHSHYYSEADFYRRMENVGRGFVILAAKYENDKKVLRRLKIKYAPFLYFPGLASFNFLSRLAASREFIKKINKKLYWFLNICFYYSQGIIGGDKKNEIA